MLRWPLTAPLAAPLAALAPLTLLIAVPAAAQVATAEVDTLARDVSRVESVRAVKDLQRSYAQYAQFGLADEMAALFASDATVTWGGTTVQGRPAILRWLKGRLGPVRGLAPGAMQTELIDEPLANLSADGTTAKVRWMFLALTGNGKGKTGVEGGILENEYKQEQGKWVIARQTFSPQYTGTYEKGWSNAGGGDLGMVPFHFTNDESGTPIPPATGPAPASGTTPTALDARIAALNTEDVVRNLVAAYGYYVDRKMWDDVVDLFTRDGRTTIAGTGEFTGAEGLRKAHETMGAQGLKQGELNDHLIFDTIVEVDPGATSATARSVVMGMIGDTHAGTASWSFQVQLVHLVLDQGLWKFRDLQIYPTMNANYADGWGKGGTYHLSKTLPAFVEPHPVTGQPVTVAGFTTVGAATPVAATSAAPASAPAPTGAEWLVDARRRYARSLAYDGVTNVSAAYGYYIDDFQWADMGGIFAKNGNKHSPFAGFYLGQDRINGAATAMYGKAPPTRSGISFHWRTQPVIHVSHDGRSANLRTRLFQPRTAKPPVPGAPASGLLNNTMNAGMYPNDQAVLENGIWRLWSLTIDEHYMSMNNWRDGWHGVKPVPPGQGAGQSPLVTRYPPDILMTTMGRRAEHFRGGTGVTLQWPDILPMWFHYKNPVSGRVPELYWPDSFPSLLLPQSRLIANGYQMPPNGPEQDGIQIELVPPEANLMEADAK